MAIYELIRQVVTADPLAAYTALVSSQNVVPVPAP
jgi:hypothetical protein